MHNYLQEMGDYEPCTIAASEPVLCASQVVAPIAWRMIATLPSALVPGDLSMFRVNLTRPHDVRDFTRETLRLAGSMPTHASGESPTLWLGELAETLDDDALLRGRACAVFYLAAAHHASRCTAEELLAGIGPEDGEATTQPRPLVASAHAFSQIRREIAYALREGRSAAASEEDDVGGATTTMLRAMHSLRRIAHVCVRYDIANRAAVCMGDLLWHLPSHTRGGMREAIVVCLGHFNRGWVAAFRRELGLGDDDRVGRVHELVRGDVSIFAIALTALKADRIASEPYMKRFAARFPCGAAAEGGTAARMALAFLYRRPALAWRAMGWTCSPREGRALKTMAEDAEGLGLSPIEAANLCLALVL